MNICIKYVHNSVLKRSEIYLVGCKKKHFLSTFYFNRLLKHCFIGNMAALKKLFCLSQVMAHVLIMGLLGKMGKEKTTTN